MAYSNDNSDIKQSTFLNARNPDVSTSLTGAAGDGITDDTSFIQSIIDYAIAQHKNVFFPSGVYLITKNINISEKVELHGDQTGLTIITTDQSNAFKIFIGNIKRPFPSSDVKIQYLFLDSIRLRFGSHFKENKFPTYDNITISNCVFFCSKHEIIADDDTEKGQVILLHTTNARIKNSVFLRSQFSYGVSIKIGTTRNTVIEQSIFGLNLYHWNSWLKEILTDWNDLPEKLLILKKKFLLLDDQGYIKSCLYTGGDKNLTVYKNVFNGSLKPKKQRDHVIYLKGFDGAHVIMNFARGWPSNPSGGLKARNGKNLEMICNYIDDTGILLYTHDPRASGYYNGLKNVVIHGNVFIVRTNIGHRTSGISYYAPHKTGLECDENFVYSSNVFHVPDPGQRPMCIQTGNGNLTEHHISHDNIYHTASEPPETIGAVPPVTVTASIPVETDKVMISDEILNSYSAYHVPYLDIPL